MGHIWWGLGAFVGGMLIVVFKYGLTPPAAFYLVFVIPISMLVSYYKYQSDH